MILPSQHQGYWRPRDRLHWPRVPGASSHTGSIHSLQSHKEQLEGNRDHGGAGHQHKPEEGRSHPPQALGAQSCREDAQPRSVKSNNLYQCQFIIIFLWMWQNLANFDHFSLVWWQSVLKLSIRVSSQPKMLCHPTRVMSALTALHLDARHQVSV